MSRALRADTVQRVDGVDGVFDMRGHAFGGGQWWSPFPSKPHDFRGQQGCSSEPVGCGPREGRSIVRQEVTAESALAVTVHGGADAFGRDTTVNADVDLQVVDRGLATFAIGRASFTAAAREDSAFATAYGGVAITGADLSIVSTRTTTGTGACGADEMSERTELSFLALDLKFDLGCRVEAEESASGAGRAKIGNLQGNSAFFDISASAAGENSFTDVQADALAVEDAMSTVAVSATAATDSEVSYTQIVGTSRSDKICAGQGDTLVFAGSGDDCIQAASGDDWLFGGRGRDTAYGGGGNDTILGQDGKDRLYGEAGDDWIFGGDGDDTVSGGNGDDLLLGGDGDDVVTGGNGNDLLCGGAGRDRLEGGAGNDIFRLGAPRGDGNDVYLGGSGRDLYLLEAAFGRDEIRDFSLAQGDRLAISDLDEIAALGRCAFTMQRSSADADDLVITFETFDRRSELTLDEFFALNPGYGGMPRRGNFSEAQAATLLKAIAIDPEGHHDLQEAQALLQLGDLLSLLG